ncbi:hypothetical protein FQV37_397 [Psychrobacter nivimaris]|uniref:Uncharacterized protein n=1 Tax=Psychrobacter nivimaris TaxID=281738 RepID=A0A6N7C0P2_9GAMM|nr:hypothetical protein FQV37_397 [Psychrobacter nivimaris]
MGSSLKLLYHCFFRYVAIIMNCDVSILYQAAYFSRLV